MRFNIAFGFLEIFKKSITIMSRNGRLVAMVTSIYLIFFSFFFVLSIYIVRPIASDFIAKAMELPSLDPQGLIFTQVLISLLKDVKNFFGVQLAFGIAQVLVTLFAQSAVILLARVSYKDKSIFHKDLIKGLPLSSGRLFMTSFHVILRKIGFFFIGFVVLMAAPWVMISDYNLVMEVVLLILIVSIYLSFSVVWVLSLVVSVLDECSGTEALGKAKRLVKGKKLDGFLLFLSINLLSYIFFYVSSRLIVVKHSEFYQEIYGFFVGSCLSLTVLLESQAFTVLYFECKKNSVDAIDLIETDEYMFEHQD